VDGLLFIVTKALVTFAAVTNLLFGFLVMGITESFIEGLLIACLSGMITGGFLLINTWFTSKLSEENRRLLSEISDISREQKLNMNKRVDDDADA
jgi:hypothetical protein